jgi:hypothetical protein
VNEQELKRTNRAVPASLKEAVQREREKYHASWKVNAAKFFADGHYDWMAEFLDGYSRVVEIGTGDGTSTMVLASKGHVVVGVEENPLSLEEAESNLRARGVQVRLVRRERLTAYGGRYQVGYKYPKGVEVVDGVTLVEGDVINDPKLISWLESADPFDAITCWCMDTHQARRWQTDLDKFGFETAGDYRGYVQRQAYLLADKLLRPGGILQTVNRGEVPRTDHLREDFLATHRRLARETSLLVQGLEYRVYEEPAEKEAVEMTVTTGLSGRIPDMSELALQSVISYKEE